MQTHRLVQANGGNKYFKNQVDGLIRDAAQSLFDARGLADVVDVRRKLLRAIGEEHKIK